MKNSSARMAKMSGRSFLLFTIAISCLVAIIFVLEFKVGTNKILKLPKFARYKVQPKKIEEFVKNKTKPCWYTKLFPGGYGAKIHDMVYAWSWSLQNGATYEGAIGSTPTANTLIQLIKVLKLPISVQQSPFKSCKLLKNHRSERWIQENPYFSPPDSQVLTKMRNIVVHVRRGDVGKEFGQTGDYYRYIPNSYFLDLLENIRRPNDKVIILSQRTDSFDDFVKAGYDVRLDTSVIEAWKSIIESDVFIMSRSSFSYVPALFAKGIVYYTEFWSKPLPHWFSNTTFILEAKRSRKIPMVETFLPCIGGEFGAKTIQTHVCVISRKTVVSFANIFDIARTVYPCMSWFAEKRAANCAFFVKDRFSNKWFDFISSKIGCAVIHSQPKVCALIAVLNTSLTSRGQISLPWTLTETSFPWLSSPVDANTLQKRVFREEVKTRGIGIINRKNPPHILNIEKLKLKADVDYLQTMSFLNQSKWMHEHDIIIATVDEDLANSVFIKKCTVIILLYPEHYYPSQHYESLIKDSGGIPISWIKNKYIGNNVNRIKESDAMFLEDFKRHKTDQSYWSTRDIETDNATLVKLLQNAKVDQTRCRTKSPDN